MTQFRQECLLNDQGHRNMTNLWALPVPTVLEKTKTDKNLTNIGYNFLKKSDQNMIFKDKIKTSIAYQQCIVAKKILHGIFRTARSCVYFVPFSSILLSNIINSFIPQRNTKTFLLQEFPLEFFLETMQKLSASICVILST